MDFWFDQLTPFLTHGSYLAVFVVLILSGVGLPVPEEITFITGGYIVDQIDGSLWLMILVGMLGILIGDTIIFFLGKRYGLEILRYLPFQTAFREKGLERSKEFFQRHGSKASFFAGFVAGIRATTFFICGSMGVSYWVFIFWDFMRAALTCPISIYLGFRFGRDAVEILAPYKFYAFGCIGFLILGFLMKKLLFQKPGPDSERFIDRLMR